MFQLSKREFENWKSQIVISNPSLKMGLRKAPLAFTEEGIAMLSSVLNSKKAIEINILIMRGFVLNPEFLQFVLTTGLGSRNSAGFGVIEKVGEIP